MAAVFAAKGFEVIGVDLNAEAVEAINAGQAPVQEPRLQELITENRARLRATASFQDAILNSDVTFIIVPTPSGPDGAFTNRYVVQAIERIGEALSQKAGYHVVVVSSTMMPGSTQDEIRPALEQASGRTVGADLGLCYNPEFIALGSVVSDLLHPDLVLIGESDHRAGEVLEAIYRRSTDSDPEIRRMNWVNAELTKISVNTYVTTKISYANMIADMCDHLAGADVDVVTQAVGADSRIGRKYLRGAVGYGGPCFPRDNRAFTMLGRRHGVNCALAEATDNINNYQIERLSTAVLKHAPSDGTIAILGMSYKPYTHVIEESQGVALAKQLAAAGRNVVIADPLAIGPAKAVLGQLVQAAGSVHEAVANADVVVITTPWKEFRTIERELSSGSGRRLTVVDPWRLIDALPLSDTVRVIRPGHGEDGDGSADADTEVGQICA